MTKGLLIGGRWVGGEGAGFESIDPATGAAVWAGAGASVGQVEAAVAAA
ncbi:hypothetical protein GVN21_20305, partial [Caulobacter sp. SLTY]|nr:hypothetical protein [Caulobacter sp. SLTY]